MSQFYLFLMLMLFLCDIGKINYIYLYFDQFI